MGRVGAVGAYLLAYNAAQALGWSAVLALSLPLPFLAGDEFAAWMASALRVAAVCQLAAGLEVIHALLGLVRGGWVASLMQWGGRSHVFFCVVMALPELHTSPALETLLVAWSASEVIRYPQYFFSIVGTCPYWLTWLRYSAFLFLYPVGVFAGEVILMYQAIGLVKKRSLYDKFFRLVPFDYSQFLIGLLLIYPLLWLQLFIYMLRQRKSKIRPAKVKSMPKSE